MLRDYDTTVNYQPDAHKGNTLPNTELPLIGRIRRGAIVYAGSSIGDHIHIGHHAVIRENNRIGHHVSIGSHTALEPGNDIGNYVRIHGHCFVVRAKIHPFVFIGPGVRFTDDPHPMCPAYLTCSQGAEIFGMASIGAGAILLPGVKIGQGALVAAGAVVANHVEAYTVVAGNPAKRVASTRELVCRNGSFGTPYEWWENFGHQYDWVRCPYCEPQGKPALLYRHTVDRFTACMTCGERWNEGDTITASRPLEEPDARSPEPF